MNMKIITDPTKIDHRKWYDFVFNHPRGNIFQTPGMYEVFVQTSNYQPIFVAVTSEDEIVGVLLGVIQKEHTGVLGRLTARSIIIGGPLIADGHNDSVNLLIKEFNVLTSDKVIYSQVRNLFPQSDISTEFEKNGYIYSEHLNILLNLKVGDDQLWTSFSRSRKKGIKKANSANFSFGISTSLEYLDSFYDLLTINYKRIKLPFPHKQHFQQLLNVFGEDNCMIFVIKNNNVTAVALFALIFKNTMYGYYMGSLDKKELLKNKPIDLLFWKVFQWAMSRNVQLFDWMGAGKPNEAYGVRNYKVQFGGELVNFGRFEKINNPVWYKTAKTMLTLWQKLG
ncbi:MAG TPA: peptidoglycan bridge formation glycyltransferase FemA/FemB family protein [Bacteroidales bacterium]|nr:peptidoglycan bridge formation glycyltransferase FemA/FemB family protein [Bacteroidales bacterium]